jgi:hypothetical protein
MNTLSRGSLAAVRKERAAGCPTGWKVPAFDAESKSAQRQELGAHDLV